MPAIISRRCTIAMLLALWCALLTALAAWGPIPVIAWTPSGSREQAGELLSQLPWAGPVTLAILIAILGQWFLVQFKTLEQVVDGLGWIWRLLLLTIAVRIAAQIYACLEMNNAVLWSQCIQAILGLLFFISILLNKVSHDFDSWINFGVIAIVFPTSSWILFGRQIGVEGVIDGRLFLMLQALPFILIPAGVLKLPECEREFSKSILGIFLYGIAFFATWFPTQKNDTGQAQIIFQGVAVFAILCLIVLAMLLARPAFRGHAYFASASLAREDSIDRSALGFGK